MATSTRVISPVIFGCMFGRYRTSARAIAQIWATLPLCMSADKGLGRLAFHPDRRQFRAVMPPVVVAAGGRFFLGGIYRRTRACGCWCRSCMKGRPYPQDRTSEIAGSPHSEVGGRERVALSHAHTVRYGTRPCNV